MLRTSERKKAGSALVSRIFILFFNQLTHGRMVQINKTAATFYSAHTKPQQCPSVQADHHRRKQV